MSIVYSSKKINLSESQIEDICNAIPINNSLPEYVAKSIINKIRTRLYNDLSNVSIYPEMYAKFKDEIVKYYYKSLAEGGLACGIMASTSLGERQTQSTLNSIDWEDKIIVNHNGKCIVSPVGKYIDDLIEKYKDNIQHIPENRTQYLELKDMDVKMPSVDEDGKTYWLKVEAVTKHLPVGDLVHVKTNFGREVKATQAKSFFVWNPKTLKFEAKNGSDIKVGDYLATCKKIDRIEEKNFLNLEEFFPKDKYLYTTELNKAKALREKYPHNWWKGYVGKDFILPYSRPDDVFDKKREVYKNIKDGLIFLYKSSRHVSEIPDHIHLDYDFGFLIGIYLAEGWCTKTFTGISNNSEVIRKRVTDWCDRYGITYNLVVSNGKGVVRKDELSSDLKLNSVLLTRLLTQLCNTGSENKKVPEFAYLANKECQRGIIDGYFSGDGYVNKKDGSVDVSSISKDLITGISFILYYFGIVGKMSSYQTKKNNIGSKNIKKAYRLLISNGFAQEFARNFTMTEPNKQERLQNITLKKNYVYLYGRSQTDFSDFKTDIVFDKIVSIDFVKSTTDYVYDFTIEKTRTFLIYNGLNLYDTFHACGLSVKTVVVGVPRFSELLNATKSPKMVNCLIYLNNDYKEISDIRNALGNSMTDITFRKLVKSYELVKDEPLEDWHYLFCSIYDIKPSNLGWRLRFYIDISVLYEYRITMKMIAKSIMEEYADSTVLYTPDWKGILDVFVDESCFTELEQLKNIFQEKIDENCEEEVEAEVEEEEEDEEDENEEEDEIDKSKKIQTTNGVTNSKILKIDRFEGKEDIIPDDIARVIHMEDKILPSIQNIRISGIPNIKDIFFEKRKEEWIISTEGSNLYGLFSNPLVDKTRTLCNDMWEIYNVFGIEAVRQFLVEEYMDVVSSDGSFVNASHVELLVDIMVYTGTIISISRYGQKKVGCGPMAKASFEESLENFLKAGINGEKESTNGVSASIMLGKMPKTGTGVFDMYLDIPKIINNQILCDETVKFSQSQNVKLLDSVKENLDESKCDKDGDKNSISLPSLPSLPHDDSSKTKPKYSLSKKSILNKKIEEIDEIKVKDFKEDKMTNMINKETRIFKKNPFFDDD